MPSKAGGRKAVLCVCRTLSGKRINSCFCGGLKNGPRINGPKKQEVQLNGRKTFVKVRTVLKRSYLRTGHCVCAFCAGNAVDTMTSRPCAKELFIAFEGKGPCPDSRRLETATWICPHPKTEVVYKLMPSEILILVL